LSALSASYAYQDDAVDALVGSDRDHYVAFEAGLGKSKVALETAQRRGVRRLLIVCPLTAVYVWLREIRKWWPGAPPVTILSTPGDAAALKRDEGIFIVTYGLFSREGGPA
jgi:SNF2 family DNA or RNA helicase